MAEDQEVSTPAQPEAVSASPAPPAEDEDKKRLSAELAAAKADAAQKAQALGEVANLVQTGKLVMAEDKPAGAAVEEDDTALVDRKELKRREQELRQQVAGAIQQQSQLAARLTRTNTMALLEPTLKNFTKYKPEIDSLLSKMDPAVAADPDTIRKAYKVVRAEHLDEEIEQEVASRAAARSEDDDYEPESEAPIRIPGAMASPTRGVAPTGDASGVGRPSSRNAGVQIRPLSREEKVAANLWGMNAEEWRRYGDKGWSPDILGSKGRRKF